MAIERDFELLDDYIANKLSGGEKEAFEQQLNSDPELKNEFQLQQKLVEGIKNARIAELKTMLKNTPVPSLPTGQSLLTKIATWTVVSGIVATGAYFLLNKGDDNKEINKPNEPAAIVENSKTIVEPSAPVAEDIQKAEDKVAVEQRAIETEKSTKKITGNTSANTPSTSKVESQETTVSQRPTVFDPSAETEANSMPDQTQNNVAKAEKEEPTVKSSTIEVSIDETNKNYTFHYQFKNGKVILYGSFERNLYEILEFFSGDKRTAFLFYKENYYLLNEDNDKIKPLVPINDPVLRNKLKEYRSK
jgi:hypothetical protein